MSYLLTQMFLYMLCTFLLGLLLGWLIWRYMAEDDGSLATLKAENDSLRKEGDDLRTNLDACRGRSAKERDDAEALRVENARLQALLDAKPVRAATVAAPVVAAAPAAAVAATPAATGTKPKGLTAARNGQPDDLKEINGVGPKMERLLNGLGYFHFDQIADWTSSEVSWVDNNLEGFKGRVTRDNWQSQAKVFAKR